MGRRRCSVSVLFNEPKLLKSDARRILQHQQRSFSALQRAEIAEIRATVVAGQALVYQRFSALQRAEIAEIVGAEAETVDAPKVSVLFNEPKLLK